MKRQAFIALALGTFLFGGGRPAMAASIPVSLDLTNVTILGSMNLNAESLPAAAFAGKSVVIPLQIMSTAPIKDPKTVDATIFFELTDADGTVQGTWQQAPVQLKADQQSNRRLNGAALIPWASYASVPAAGHLRYYFVARKLGASFYFTPTHSGALAGPGNTAPLDSFDVAFIDTVRLNVPSLGGFFHIDDTYKTDGKTAVSFAPDSLSGPGTLTIHQENLLSVPSGPGGLRPIVAFTFTLEGMTLVRTADVTLSYPSNADGSVGQDRLNWRDLALYSYSGPNGWELVSRPQTDPTLHTVTGVTTHFSMFALFPTGPIGAADIRPKQRIITPNGDGINDFAEFVGLTHQDEVHLFDMRGRRIATLQGPPFKWYGKDDSGKVVESGVYLYQYTSQGERVSGVIVVAK